MSAPANSSYFSRFVVKFVEIIAAGLATAVSGYVIAHFSGALSSPAPAPASAVIQITPSASAVSNSPAQPAPASASPASSPAPVAPVSGKASEQPLLPQQEVNAPSSTQTVRKTVSTAKAEPARKQKEHPTTPAREQESFVSRVRAALTSVDVNRAEAVAPPASNATGTLAPIGQQRPLINQPHAVAVPGAPAAAAESGPLARPASPLAPDQVTPIDIKSSPIVASPPAPVVEKEPGVLSVLDQMLRHDPLPTTDDVPRPPMPVGR
jgi:hypothetical protein